MSRSNNKVQGMISDALKGLIVIGCGFIANSYHELNATMKDLTSVTRAIELRVNTIESDRSAKTEQYKSFVTEMQNMKTDYQALKVDFSQIQTRLQTMSDFIVKNFNSRK